ncbi:MAG: TolC family protein [Pirellulaceae bacterium]
MHLRTNKDMHPYRGGIVHFVISMSTSILCRLACLAAMAAIVGCSSTGRPLTALWGEESPSLEARIPDDVSVETEAVETEGRADGRADGNTTIARASYVAPVEEADVVGTDVVETDVAAETTSRAPSNALTAMLQTAPAQEQLPDAEATSTLVPLGGGEQVLDMDLASAIQMAAGQNPRVQTALARIQEAYARQMAANALWLPSLRIGGSYNRHDGNYQASSGEAVDVNRSSLNTGLGVGAVGAGPVPLPGVGANFKAGDAIFRPRIADRQLAATQFAATAESNQVMLQAALAYFELMRAFGQYAIAGETLDNAKELAELTRSFADNGEGLQADADRAQVELTLRENEVQRALEAVDTASARLAMQLSIDPTIRIAPQEATVAPLDLVAWDVPARELVATALSRRPELAEAGSLAQAAALELRRERLAPLLPSVLLGFSYGGFGGGFGASGATDDFGERLDYDAVAYWEVRNFGLGELAARDSAGSRVQQARWRQMRLLDQVATEVAESHAQVRARGVQIATAERGVKLARDSYRRNFQRIREGQGLPIEVLQSLQALDQMQREYLRTVVDYNTAQFRLQWAMGWPEA